MLRFLVNNIFGYCTYQLQLKYCSLSFHLQGKNSSVSTINLVDKLVLR